MLNELEQAQQAMHGRAMQTEEAISMWRTNSNPQSYEYMRACVAALNGAIALVARLELEAPPPTRTA